MFYAGFESTPRMALNTFIEVKIVHSVSDIDFQTIEIHPNIFNKLKVGRP